MKAAVFFSTIVLAAVCFGQGEFYIPDYNWSHAAEVRHAAKEESGYRLNDNDFIIEIMNHYQISPLKAYERAEQLGATKIIYALGNSAYQYDRQIKAYFEKGILGFFVRTVYKDACVRLFWPDTTAKYHITVSKSDSTGKITSAFGPWTMLTMPENYSSMAVARAAARFSQAEKILGGESLAESYKRVFEYLGEWQGEEYGFGILPRVEDMEKITVTHQLKPGLNFVSLPGYAADMSVAALFPNERFGLARQLNGTSCLDNVYELEPGTGYLVNYPDSVLVEIEIMPIKKYERYFKPCQHMISGLNESAEIKVEKGSISLPFWLYSQGSWYSSNTLFLPANSIAWLSLKEDCQLKVVAVDTQEMVKLGKRLSGKMPNELLEILGEDDEKSNSFILLPNYPNPANPQTTFCFELFSPQEVELKIYNLLGEELAILMNECKPAGEYSIKWDGKNMATGAYFYQFKVGDKTVVRKLMLMK